MGWGKKWQNVIFHVKQILVDWSHLVKHSFDGKVIIDKYMQSNMRNTNMVFVFPGFWCFCILGQKAVYCWSKSNFLLKEPNIGL